MSLPDHHRKMFAFDTWANQLAISSIESVPASRRTEPQYVKALGIMAHIALAKRVWLARLRGAIDRPADWFPAWSPAEAREALSAIDRGWAALLEGLDETGLEQTVSYQSADGIGFRNSVGDTLAHVANHGTYHRGQIASLVHGLGGQRATTDYIITARQRTQG